jgi:hypothetical protein
MFKNAINLENFLDIISTIWMIKNDIYSLTLNFTIIQDIHIFRKIRVFPEVHGDIILLYKLITVL